MPDGTRDSTKQGILPSADRPLHTRSTGNIETERTLMTRWSIMPSSEATLSEITMKARATTNIADDNARSLHIKIRRR